MSEPPVPAPPALEQPSSVPPSVYGGASSGVAPGAPAEPATPLGVMWVAVIVAVGVLTLLGHQLSVILQPFLAACFLCYLVVPLVRQMTRARVPRPVGYLAVAFLFVGVFWLIGYILGLSFEQLQERMPVYEHNLRQALGQASDFAATIGFIARGESLTFEHLSEVLPHNWSVEVLSGAGSFFVQMAASITVVAFFMVFLLYEAEYFAERVRRAYGPARAARVLAVVRQINRDIHRYILIKAVVSAVTAGVAFVLMLMMGLDFAPLLALLIFLFNFIPYIGSIVATLLPGAVALMQFPVITKALWVVVLITIVQQVIGNVLEPHLQGRKLNVSPLLILLSLAYFGWMWGVVGMIISVPVVAALRLLFEQSARTRALAAMMSEVH